MSRFFLLHLDFISFFYTILLSIDNYRQECLDTALCNHNLKSFWERDVLDSFIMAYRDEDSLLDQIYAKQIYSAFFYKDLEILRLISGNAYLKKYSTLQQGTQKNWVLVLIQC